MTGEARWPALVLAAGLGTRCRPLSYVRAKPAFPVAGETLARRLLRYLSASGITEVVINLHHKPETVEAAVAEGPDLGVHVKYSREHVILGSAGGPRRAIRLLDRPRFLIVNGDTLCPVDLKALSAAHERTGASVTMALVQNPDPQRYGNVFVDAGGAVLSFGRAGITTATPGCHALHFVGIQMVESSVFATLPPDVYAETVGSLYPRLIAERPGSVMAFRSSAPFLDVGTPADYMEASFSVAAGEGRLTLPPGRGSTVEVGAVMEQTVVWDNVVIGANCRLRNCVVADGVVLPAGTRLEGCAVVRREDVPAGSAAKTGVAFHAEPLTTVRQPEAGNL